MYYYLKLIPLALLTLCLQSIQAQKYSQMAFSEVKEQATQLVQSGNLSDALPILRELVNRVEDAKESGFEIDYPIFLIGSAYVQNFIKNNQAKELTNALNWYNRLERDYPKSKHLKSALLKRIDILRALKRSDEAIALMQSLLSGQRAGINLSYQEDLKLHKDLSEIFYQKKRLKEGLPYFVQLLSKARTTEERGLAAAASFEAYLANKELDEAMRLLPFLAQESEMRYQPRLNVALLKASDTLTDNGRLIDTSILLNLIKTTDLMVEYYKDSIANDEKRIATYEAINLSEDRLNELRQKVKKQKTILANLIKLPTLRNELLVRRARNFSKTLRPYESFWMFYDLLKENPDHEQVEFYHYASFSGAKKINKISVVLELGRSYRDQYPKGDYYSDVTAELVTQLQKMEAFSEMVEIIVDFLDRFPTDPFASNFLAIWGGHVLEKENYQTIIDQCAKWQQMHSNPTFGDGLYFWPALAHLQQSDFKPAVDDFTALIENYPNSLYLEDASLRKGICEFYLEDYEASRTSLLAFTDQFKQSQTIDQAFYFLGEIEALVGDLDTAIVYFEKADARTNNQLMHDTIAFRLGFILETQEKFEAMRDHFLAYIDRFAEKGKITDAYIQTGRAYEFLNQPNKMLELYRNTIERYASNTKNQGIDTLIESYAEKYYQNLKKLNRTVEFLNQMQDDLEYRKTMLSDRGALFEVFYYDTEIDPTLYNLLRNHPDFTMALMEDVTPLLKIGPDYHSELANYPEETPEVFFSSLKKQFQLKKDFVAETRMLMGLFRLGNIEAPSQNFSIDRIQKFTPRLLLYVADYAQANNPTLATKTWEYLLEKYPANDAVIVARIRLADTLAKTNQLQEALEHLIAVEVAFPGTPQLPAIILKQGDLLSQLGKGDAARQKYQYILKITEWRGIAHARALLQTGAAYMAEEKYQQAHGFFERTFLGFSNFPEVAAKAYLADANALLKLNDSAGAKSTLEEAVTELEGAIEPAMFNQIKDKLATL